MRCITEDNNHRKFKRKPFLILPIIENNLIIKHNINCYHSKKTMGLKLVTRGGGGNTPIINENGTWPPKFKKSSSIERPRTATLEKPKLLDISLIGKIDMSMMRKELLTITNLCKVPITPVSIVESTQQKKVHAQKCDNSTGITKGRVRRSAAGNCRSSEDESSTPIVSGRRSKRTTIKVCTITTEKTEKIFKKPIKNINDDNNNRNVKNLTVRVKKITDNVLVNIGKKHLEPILLPTDQKLPLPEPCQTCGRVNQPERFHSHPKSANKLADTKTVDKSPRKSPKKSPTVFERMSKPKSKVDTPKKENKAPRKAVEVSTPKNTTERPVSAAKKPRTLMCYLCGREFGTASLPLHEPKCLQKWERENEQLPPRLRRTPPAKPDHALTSEQWNEFAWNASQATLTPCRNCGRTFLPDRLEVHQRSCKSSNNKSNNNTPRLVVSDGSGGAGGDTRESGGSGWASPAPAGVACYICARRFGTRSIAIHEPQCLRKWQQNNEQLPQAQRRPTPRRQGDQLASPTQLNPITSSATTGDLLQLQSVSPTPPLTPVPRRKSSGGGGVRMRSCHLCGRGFTSRSLRIHEPQCATKWRVQNAALPAHLRRSEPPPQPKPVLDDEGKIDFEATNELMWKTHLSQLVPCKKCGRTFNPDRVEVHERSCKGPTH